MRNLKKILSLLLALSMSSSLVTIASADNSAKADESTTNTVNPAYEDATEVLKAMHIFQGDETKDGEEVDYRWDETLTREEAATIMYRIIANDVEEKKTDLYVGAAKFSDVKDTRWSAGVIGYSYNGEIIKGFENGTFRPEDEVTGFQVLAMILRAIGYDANDEFTGNDWEIQVGKTAQELGIIDKIDGVELRKPVTREVVAQILYSTMNADMVKWSNAFHYNPTGTTLGKKNFNLSVKTETDTWGRPYYYWSFNCGDEEYARYYEALATYTTAATECHITEDVNKGKTFTTELWVNGDRKGVTAVNGDFTATTYTIRNNVQNHSYGAQGRVTEVYYVEDEGYRTVMVDTFLAKVVNKTSVVKDSAGHVVTPAKLTLKVYDGTSGNASVEHVVEGYSDWSYAVGDYVLINATTTGADENDEHGTVRDDSSKYYYVNVLGTPDYIDGSQTLIHYNAKKHTVNNTEYNDNLTYTLDIASGNIGAFRWFFDENGNIIGSVALENTYTYGVIEKIQWVTQIGSAGYAQATVRLMDNTTKSVKIDQIAVDGSNVGSGKTDTGYESLTYADNQPGTRDNANVSTEWTNNEDWLGADLYRIEDLGNGYVNMANVANNTVGNVLNHKGYLVTNTKLVKGSYKNLWSNYYLNSDTVFLYGYYSESNNFTPVQYVGFNNIYTTDADEIDFVDLDGDRYVDYVYVRAEVGSVRKAGLFYMTGTAHQMTLQGANGLTENVYAIDGYLDGTQTTVYVSASKNHLMTQMVNAYNTNGGHAMMAVAIENDRVVNVKSLEQGSEVVSGVTVDTAKNTLGTMMQNDWQDENGVNTDYKWSSWSSSQYEANRYDLGDADKNSNQTKFKYARMKSDVLEVYYGTSKTDYDSGKTTADSYKVTNATQVCIVSANGTVLTESALNGSSFVYFEQGDTVYVVADMNGNAKWIVVYQSSAMNDSSNNKGNYYTDYVVNLVGESKRAILKIQTVTTDAVTNKEITDLRVDWKQSYLNNFTVKADLRLDTGSTVYDVVLTFNDKDEAIIDSSKFGALDSLNASSTLTVSNVRVCDPVYGTVIYNVTGGNITVNK